MIDADRRLPVWIGLQILFSWGPVIDNARAGQTVQGVPNGPRAQEEMHVLGWEANPNSFVGWLGRPLNSADCKRFLKCNERQGEFDVSTFHAKCLAGLVFSPEQAGTHKSSKASPQDASRLSWWRCRMRRMGFRCSSVHSQHHMLNNPFVMMWPKCASVADWIKKECSNLQKNIWKCDLNMLGALFIPLPRHGGVAHVLPAR